jgi:glutathionylspermidine synthase
VNRVTHPPRIGWEAKVEQLGLVYHSPDGQRYWDETVHYEFRADEVEELERAVASLQELCIDAAQHVIDADRFAEFGIDPAVAAAIRRAWDAEPPSIYGRFDLAYDGSQPPKLLEYNADTPTALLEAAVVQWHWLQDVSPASDQWNSIHERLVAKWRDLAPHLPPTLHFAHVDERSHEDVMTVTYLRDTAMEAGLESAGVEVSSIGLAERRGVFEFVDAMNRPIRALFKLYPWEWLLGEQGRQAALDALADGMIWIEPVWKMLWSNKAILPVLWELFPGHPNLLPAFRHDAHGLPAYARKPKLSREGANVTIVDGGVEIERTDGDYGEEGFIYQALGPVPSFDGQHPVIGAWVIDGAAAGMGIRESRERVTGNRSRFVPHLIL